MSEVVQEVKLDESEKATYSRMLSTVVNCFFVVCGMYMAKILCNSNLNNGFEDALSARYSFAAVSASGSFPGVSPLSALTAVEYSLSATATSVLRFAVDVGLTAGMTVSAMANSVFHCAGVSGSSAGNGGKGVAFGETGSVGRDIVRARVQGWPWC